LFHAAVAMGIIATLAYWAMVGEKSAAIISVIVGFTYMTGSLVQYDLAARACPVSAAGTTFAVLMSLSNLSMSLSIGLGGYLYDRWSAAWGSVTAFNALVAAGALTTCACWVLLPLLDRIPETEGDGPSSPEP
jgi:hypothetical protein